MTVYGFHSRFVAERLRKQAIGAAPMRTELAEPTEVWLIKTPAEGIAPKRAAQCDAYLVTVSEAGDVGETAATDSEGNQIKLTVANYSATTTLKPDAFYAVQRWTGGILVVHWGDCP